MGLMERRESGPHYREYELLIIYRREQFQKRLVHAPEHALLGPCHRSRMLRLLARGVARFSPMRHAGADTDF